MLPLRSACSHVQQRANSFLPKEEGTSKLCSDKQSFICDLRQVCLGTAMSRNNQCVSPWYFPSLIFPGPCFKAVILLETHIVKHTTPHIQTPQFSLPLPEACWGPEHALSRYELGENSSSGLVSMIWWEVLLSSNGIWQLTGGGLWELGSWADGRRLDEDVGGMGRPGKEDRGVKGQHECHESIQRKLHWNHLAIKIPWKKKKEDRKKRKCSRCVWSSGVMSLQMAKFTLPVISCMFQKAGMSRNSRLRSRRGTSLENIHFFLCPLLLS